MATFALIAAQTAAADSPPFDSSQYSKFTVSADLSGGETVDIYILVGGLNGVPRVVTLPDMTPAKLTSVVSALPIEGGPYYMFHKSATAAAKAVFVDPFRG